MKQKKHIIAFLIFFLASTYITFPLIFNMGSLVTGFGDELNYAWMYNWIIHSVLSGNILHLYNTNIFYPYNIALSDSDPNIISALLAIIPFIITHEPISAVNFTLISSLILLGLSLYSLAYYLTKDFLAALLSGLLIIFSPAVLSFYAHLQMIAVYFVPIAMLFFFHFLKKGKWKFLVFSLLCFVFQTYNNFIAGYFILFSFTIILLIYAFAQKNKFKKLINKRNISTIIVAVLLLIPIAIPYYQVAKEFHYVRDIKDSVHLAIQPEDLLYASIFSRSHSIVNALPFNQISQNNEFKPGFVGIVFTFLLGFSLYLFRKYKKKTIELKSLFVIRLTGIVLSLGPVLHLGRQTIHEPFLIPLTYALFYYVVPGFQGFRNAARWEMLFIIAFAVFIAVFVHLLTKTYSVKKKLIIYCVLFVGIIAEYNFPMQFEKIPQKREFPSVYHWLAVQPRETKIVEMPVYNWDMLPYSNEEFWRLYYSTVHFKRTVNGGGGFTPPPWTEMVYKLNASFPNNYSINTLKSIGIRYVIVHKSEYDVMYKDDYKIKDKKVKSGKQIIELLEHDKKLKKKKQDKDIYVFEIK